MKVADSTQATRFNKYFVHLECIPFPGPPEENELALPNKTLRMLKSSIFLDLNSADGKATA